MEINDIPHKGSVIFREDDMICLRLSSEDDEACKKMQCLIATLFGEQKWIYKSISFIEDLEAVKRCCKNGTIKLFKGKAKFKLFTISYPELHAEISNSDDLLEVLRSWSSAAYQTQVLYVADAKYKEHIFSMLENDLYKDDDSISLLWPFISIAIRNQPEAEHNNTFLLFLHTQHLRSIEKILEI